MPLVFYLFHCEWPRCPGHFDSNLFYLLPFSMPFLPNAHMLACIWVEFVSLVHGRRPATSLPTPVCRWLQ